MAKSVGQASVDLEARTKKFQAKMRAASQSVQDFQKSAAATERRFQKSGKKMQKAGAQMSKALTLPSAVAGGLAVKAFADFETAITEIQKVSSKGVADQMTSEIREMAKTIPLSQTRLADLAAQAARFGIEGSDNIRKFTEVVGKMSFATDLAADEAGTALAKLTTLTDATQSEIENLGSAINSLGNNFATSQKEITEATLRSGAAATQFGLTAEQAVAFNASMNEVSESASRAGTRLRRVFQELQEPKKVAKVASALGMTAEEFANLKKESPLKAIMKVVDAFDTATAQGKELQSAFSSASRQALAGLKQNFDGLNQAVDVSNEQMKEGSSLQREFELVTKNLNAQFTLLFNKVKDVGISFGKALLPVVKRVMGAVRGFLDMLDGMSDAAKRNTVIITSLVAAMGPLVFVTGKLTKVTGGAIGAISRIAVRMSAFRKSVKATRAVMATTGFGGIAILGTIAVTVATQQLPKLLDAFDNTQMAAKKMGGELEHVSTLNDKMKSEFAEQVNQLDLIIRKIKGTAKGTDAHRKAIEKLKAEYGGHIENLRNEKGQLKDLNRIRKEVVDNLKNQLLVEQNRKKIKEILNKETKEEQELFEQRSKTVKKLGVSFKNLNIQYTDLNNILSSNIPLVKRFVAEELKLNTATQQGNTAAEEATRVLQQMAAIRERSRKKVRQLREEINKYADSLDKANKKDQPTGGGGDGGGGGGQAKAQKKTQSATQGTIEKMKKLQIQVRGVAAEGTKLAQNWSSELPPVEEQIGRLEAKFREIDEMEANPAIEVGKAEAGMQKIEAFREAVEKLIETNNLTAESMMRLRQEFPRIAMNARRAAETMIISGKKMAKSVEKSIESMVTKFAKGIGKMMAGAKTMESVGKTVVIAFLNLFSQIGQMMIETAIFVAAFKNSVISAPVAAIAIGAALVAFAEGAKAKLKQQQSKDAPKMAEGGIAFDETLATVGDNKDSRTNPEVVAPLDKLKGMMGDTKKKEVVVLETRVKGEDIALSQQRRDRRRAKNFGRS